MTIKRTRFEVGVEVTPTSVPLTREGEIRSNESSKELEVFLDEETRVVVTENQEQVLENKEIDADLNTISNLEVDNLKAGVLNVDPNLTGATNQQLPSALVVKTLTDGIKQDLADLELIVDTNSTDISNLTDRVDSLEIDLNATEDALDNHILNPTDAHDASAISTQPISGVSGNNVQENLESIKLLVDNASKSKGITKVRLLDSMSLTLPLGTVVIDGITPVNGDKVLFSNLTVNPNRIYSAVVVGSDVVSWNLEDEFAGTAIPSNGDFVVILEGILFGSQLGKYNVDKFVFNDYVRYFNGNDYFEQSSLLTSTLLDNQSTPQVATEYNYVGSEYSIIEASIARGSARELIIIVVTTDGTNVAISQHGSTLSETGITLSSDIDSGKIRILYTSTSNGLDATMKFNVRRWSNSAGGPSGVPSYSGSSVTGGVTSSGSPMNGQLAIFTNANDITGSSNLTFNISNNTLVVNGLTISGKSTITLLNNMTNSVAMSFDIATSECVFIDYSITRNGERRAGTAILTHNGSIASVGGLNTETNALGIVFDADVVSGNMRLLYTSTNTTFDSTMKFTFRKWM